MYRTAEQWQHVWQAAGRQSRQGGRSRHRQSDHENRLTVNHLMRTRSNLQIHFHAIHPPAHIREASRSKAPVQGTTICRAEVARRGPLRTRRRGNSNGVTARNSLIKGHQVWKKSWPRPRHRLRHRMLRRLAGCLHMPPMCFEVD